MTENMVNSGRGPYLAEGPAADDLIAACTDIAAAVIANQPPGTPLQDALGDVFAAILADLRIIPER